MQKGDKTHKTEYVEALDLESAAAWTNTLNTKPDNITVVILVGTNDIRIVKSAAQCDKEHQSMTEKLNDLEIPHAIFQAPPIYAVQLKDRQLEREIVKFITRLESRLNADTLISMENLENDRSLIDKKRRNPPHPPLKPNRSNTYRKPPPKDQRTQYSRRPNNRRPNSRNGQQQCNHQPTKPNTTHPPATNKRRNHQNHAHSNRQVWRHSGDRRNWHQKSSENNRTGR